MDKLSGSIERITYYNDENGYSVIRLRPDTKKIPQRNFDGLVTVVGNLPELTPGEYVYLKGQWSNHPKHGMQFKVDTCEQTIPATTDAIRRYLGSGLIKGIGPKLAERIVDQFGKDSLEIIENQSERLLEVPDIGRKRTKMIREAWEEQKQIKEVMLFLHGHQISTTLAVKIYKQYGDETLHILQSDPYRLAEDIFGIGFKTADRIAQALGLPKEHPSRIEAGIVYALNQATNEGHVFEPRLKLAEIAQELLDVPLELVEPAIDQLLKEKKITLDELPADNENRKPSSQVGESRQSYFFPAIYLSPLYHSEVNVAKHLKRITQTMPSALSDIPGVFIKLDKNLSPEQHSAIKTAISSPLSILTGGPGTGKTTALRALILILEEANKRYALASPTGRAAKRLSQATGRKASTIHRLLGFSPKEGFKFNRTNPLQIDMLIVDEASMMDLFLTNHLVQAIQEGTHLLLVGDVDQLPSVGAGDVLRDIIDSSIAPVTRLTTIFRQSAESQIIQNAHLINHGKMPVFNVQKAGSDSNSPGDFFLFPAENAEEGGDWIENLVCERIPKKFGFDPINEIQVLSPMYRGAAGVTALNERLQAKLNPQSPAKPEKRIYGRTFRIGDKLMQIQNNYDKGVFNGDIGFLTAIDPINQSLTVNFEGQMVEYDWTEADQLVLAYTVSVHKAQGSEFPAVVLPVLTQHYMMLQRNLLYTAITRAKQLCVLVGNHKAIGIAVRNNKVTQRFTALDWRLE